MRNPDFSLENALAATDEADDVPTLGTEACDAEVKHVFATRREAGLQIDPATAKVTRGLINEIYFGVHDLPNGDKLPIEYFARAPESEVWVAFRDLPVKTRETLSAKQRARELEIEKFLAGRREAGLRIDPATAEVEWGFTEVLDPYGVEGVPEGYSCVGRQYFARAPGSDTWVAFEDLPEKTLRALSTTQKPSFTVDRLRKKVIWNI